MASSSSVPEQKINEQTVDTIPNKNDKIIITVPLPETNTITGNDTEELTAKNIPAKGGPNEKVRKEEIKKTDSSDNFDKNIIASNITPSYIIIEGPQGKLVKVSSKMATLIDSSVESVPTKPIWNKKINEWREIMKGNTLAPTPGNFMDIIELTKTVKDRK